MGGGHFGYKQYHINQIADEIEKILDQQGKKIKKRDRIFVNSYYEEHPEEKFYPVYSDIIQEKMKEAIKQLRIASIYAQRIDWFLSGDDSEESFIEELDDELKELQ